jgi:pyruvate dehydrogenase E2 component (dihydrolipoamide acetyltransferase)
MPEILMPRLSDSMEEGTILAWLVSPGEEVALGQEIAEIETDKANMAYESDLAGTLTEILVAEGQSAPIGSPIAVIGAPGEAVASPAPAVPATPATAPGAGGRVKASPLARRLAEERGVELASIAGSGPAGRIVKADVEGAARGAGAAPASPGPSAAPVQESAKGEVTYLEPDKTQRVIARRMAESKATAPHFYLTTEIEMTRAVKARAALKAAAGEGEVLPSFNDMVLKACALALRERPKANGAYRDGRFELYSRVNVGVAVAAPGTLLVPTVFDADVKGLRQIAAETRALAAKVREATITPPELAGATFTVSNLGMYGVESFAAVINSPQAAILAVGAIQERVLFRDGAPHPAQLMKATLSCDHRVLYGAEGAELLARVRALLEEPVSLAL